MPFHLESFIFKSEFFLLGPAPKTLNTLLSLPCLIFLMLTSFILACLICNLCTSRLSGLLLSLWPRPHRSEKWLGPEYWELWIFVRTKLRPVLMLLALCWLTKRVRAAWGVSSRNTGEKDQDGSSINGPFCATGNGTSRVRVAKQAQTLVYFVNRPSSVDYSSRFFHIMCYFCPVV